MGVSAGPSSLTAPKEGPSPPPSSSSVWPSGHSLSRGCVARLPVLTWHLLPVSLLLSRGHESYWVRGQPSPWSLVFSNSISDDPPQIRTRSWTPGLGLQHSFLGTQFSHNDQELELKGGKGRLTESQGGSFCRRGHHSRAGGQTQADKRGRTYKLGERVCASATWNSEEAPVSLKSCDHAGPLSTRLSMATAMAAGMRRHCQVTLTGTQSRQGGTSASSCSRRPCPSGALLAGPTRKPPGRGGGRCAESPPSIPERAREGGVAGQGPPLLQSFLQTAGVTSS